MRESVIEKYLVRSIRELGGDCRKVRFLDRKGAPDRLVMVPESRGPSGTLYQRSRTLWIELKATGKQPTALQYREHKRMRALGQDVRVIDSVEGVDALVQELMG